MTNDDDFAGYPTYAETRRARPEQIAGARRAATRWVGANVGGSAAALNELFDALDLWPTEDERCREAR